MTLFHRNVRANARNVLVILFVGFLGISQAAAGGNREESERGSGPDEDTRIELGNSTEDPQSDPEPDRESETEQNDTTEDDQSAGEPRIVETDRPIWALVDHEMNDQMVAEISGFIRQGYTPVGLEVQDEEISLLYASTQELSFNRWIIREFTDLDNLNTDMSAFLLDGWTPMDISKTEAGLSVLFIKGDTGRELLGWRIHEVSALDAREALQTLESYRDAGFVAYGVTIDREDNEFWFLMLQYDRPEGAEVARVALNGFENDQIEAGITRDIENGLLPWGLARGRNATFVLYLF